jgi:hypothetical protein
MSIEKRLRSVIIPRNDTRENWSNATNFIPKKGELVTFKGSDGKHSRLKVGDGVPNSEGKIEGTNVNDLPFIEIQSSTENSSKYKVEDDLLELK